MEQQSDMEGICRMRTQALRLKVEQLRQQAQGARAVGPLKRMVAEFAEDVLTDKRKRVTPELIMAVVAAACAKMTVAQMERKLGLSAPTIRKILRTNHVI
jgi:hypothetical protein